jgi:hypothetical protein
MKFFLALTLLAAVALAATCDTEKKAYDDAKTAVDKEEIADIKAELQKEADAKKKAYDECVAKASNCPTKKEDCKDTNDSCAGWAKAGECTANPKWMNPNCPSSCCPICGTKKALKAGECPETGDYGACLANSANKDHTCQKWASAGKKSGTSLVSECGANKEWMVTNCMQSCCKTCFYSENGCPTLDVKDVKDQEFKEDGDKVVAKEDLVERCVDAPEKPHTAENCADWAKKGECTKNPTWMLRNCKKSCCPVCQPKMPAAVPTAKPTAKPTAAAVRYVQQSPYYQAAPRYSGYSTASYAPQYSGYSTGSYLGGYGGFVSGQGLGYNYGR